ncbi:hypothetical protein like AT3G52440 [Hibiscus trionum]|uniref:Dof zinc finger protein n=1 Tax=Hibiscus trionum TaxID=183268 RepID=A0A9W7GTG2_HIBTR|nr:hypothetical protein like AT3G52440 [Hibiscus trionum]
MERGWKPRMEISPNCPRCGSSNTKFCYYNNYSLTQPRYFCKGCRRYWTKGGSLRNVPVGGGCRKNRRGKSLRLVPTDGVHSKSLSCDSIKHSYASAESNCSSDMSDGSHIDLALVYANFLNDQQLETNLSTENHLNNNEQIHYPGNYSLPPLPGDDFSWSSSPSSISPSLQATQEPNQLFGNWNPFDLYSDDTFSRT